MNKQKIFLFLVTSLLFNVQGQERSMVQIKGFAPDYIGKSVDVFEIDDYLSFKESKIASSEVHKDSLFSVSFFVDETKKIILKSGKNTTYMYIQPDAKYTVYFPDRDKYDPFRPAGNQVELTFFGLDSNDINYKILMFNRWADDFVARNVGLIKTNPGRYNQLMDSFKMSVQNIYIADTGKYTYDYVRFNLATLDNIQQAGDRNRYEKHDFYLKYSPVSYDNDAYMDYFTNFYEGLIPRLAMECNNRVYLGVLKSSPTMVMRALGMEYTLIKMRIREMAMIQSLSEVYYGGDFPQTNILTILDSVSKHAMFEEHKLIATNMISRLTDIVPGGKAPDFAIINLEGELKTLGDFEKKHLYIHFFDPTSDKNIIEIPLLLDLQKRYAQDVTFITIINRENITPLTKKVVDQLKWGVFSVPSDNLIYKNYKIQTYPNYVFLDGYSYVISSPALGPQPNGSYETIDRSFFQLQKMNKEMRGE